MKFGRSIGTAVVEKKFLNVANAFSLFCYYLYLEKGVSLHLNTFEFPLPECLVEIGQVALEKKISQSRQCIPHCRFYLFGGNGVSHLSLHTRMDFTCHFWLKLAQQWF